MIYAFVFFAAISSAYFAYRKSPLEAFLKIYLPFFVFIPMYYGITFHGVLINPACAASLPILAATLTRPGMRWKWQWTDLLILAYVLEEFYSQYSSVPDFSIAGADAVATALSILPAYFFGRYLFESKEARVSVVKRFVYLLFVVAILSVYEYRLAMNPFEIMFSVLFKMPSFFLQQLRWGFARVAGPFGHAILAGIMFVSAFLFQLWLNANDRWEPKFKKAKWLPWKKTTWITIVLAGGVWMTQSRGPWMGGALGFIIFLATRAKRLKSGITKALVLMLVLFGVFYVVTDRYTDPGDQAMSSDKENAVYRRQLITNYMPAVKAGGMLGWGRDWPRVPGQDSIDNFYLLTTLEYGYAGLGLFVVMAVVTGFRLLRAAWTFKNREDATFALCLLGIFVSITATLTTVFLGAQVIVFLFMILGWSQALVKRKELVPVTVSDAQQVSMERFAYRRVFS
jgi:hypothetical protein